MRYTHTPSHSFTTPRPLGFAPHAHRPAAGSRTRRPRLNLRARASPVGLRDGRAIGGAGAEKHEHANGLGFTDRWGIRSVDDAEFAPPPTGPEE